ncbi:uncharacterized protein K489DRAFT_381464 [Dissoconium aciculare CBS 342.82]|uniref:Uncharacterized protein n=1 Tax=Dissoconium aciculare CBS 342.82 TaxID=1314786 RepID=A0A6J3M0P9_9PEZI|nr:uncharacterized protein K489DRAFT_381464 [Dissoconium aciculare CBS 342.82]KAF1821473.1 hypothetical protein K489DRAFT_381464 [Dissoconium aciculare CBS 342.82]
MKFLFATIAIASTVIGTIAAPTSHQGSVSKIDENGIERIIHWDHSRDLNARQDDEDIPPIPPIPSSAGDDDDETLLDPATPRSLPIGQNNVQDGKVKIPVRQGLTVR